MNAIKVASIICNGFTFFDSSRLLSPTVAHSRVLCRIDFCAIQIYKMVQIKSDTIKVLYVLLLVSIKCILVESESIKLNHTIVTFVHFEKLKNDFFLTNPMNISSENNVHCFTELNAIKNGIKNSEKWAAEGIVYLSIVKNK